MPLTIDFIADFSCPWCFIGQTRLFRALEDIQATGQKLDVHVNWLPFFLDDTLPPEGEPYPAFLQAKFGSQNRINAMLDRVTEAGRSDGLEFAFDRIPRRPNTLQAHRLCYRAQSQGEHPERVRTLTDALFAAHFQQGLDIGNPEVLADIVAAIPPSAPTDTTKPAEPTDPTHQTHPAATSGKKREDTLAYLAGQTDIAPLTRMAQKIRQQGITGVPFFILNRRLTVSGTQSPATLGAAILQAASSR